MGIYHFALAFALIGTSLASGQTWYSSTNLDEVLTTECFSSIDRRQAIEAARASDAPSSAWWQSGYVRQAKEWITFEDAIQRASTDRTLQTYHEKLGRTSHKRLASWSRRNRLRARYRAHLIAAQDRSLLTNEAYKQMGYQQHNDRWISPEAAVRFAEQRREIKASLNRWGATLTTLRNDMASSPASLSQAKARLDEIKDPSAVHAIHQTLSEGNAVCQRAAAEALARIASVDSTAILVNYALFTPLKSVRDTSLAALRARPKEHFVPGLLGLLTDAEARVTSSIPPASQILLGASLQLSCRAETTKQIQIRKHGLTVTSRSVDLVTEEAVGPDTFDFRYFGRMPMNSGYLKWKQIRFLLLPSTVRHFEYLGRREVERCEAFNAQVISTLSATCDHNSADPKSWWSWWNRYTDVDVHAKEVVETDIQSEVTFWVAASCFTSGTPVVSERGHLAIDELQIGDKVLSQDIQTGELQFRVVRQTTVRPPRPTYTLRFGDDVIECTGGHNFWKAGAGWIKARDLEVGDRIRTPTGTEAVAAVAEGEPEKTYNLVVEGFHTYFVGDSKLLVQDVLPITPTDNVLPGFSKFELGEDAPKSDRSE